MIANRIIAFIFISAATTLAASGQPIAGFTVDRYNVCSGTTVSFTNTSTSSNSYEWKIEGSHYSYSLDTVATLVEPCYDLLEVRLIARDTISGLSDSTSRFLEVLDTCFFHWTGDFFACPGDTITLGTSPEEIATEFIFSSPQTILNGCLTCSSITFVLDSSGLMVDRRSTYLGGCFEITSFHYLCTMGVNEMTKPQIKIFPNPVSSNLVIEANANLRSVSICDFLGKTVLVADGNGRRQEIDMGSFASGAYVVKIEFESGILFNSKIVK